MLSLEELVRYLLILMLDWMKLKKTKKKSVTEEVNQSIMSIKNMINIIGGTTSKFNLEIPVNVTMLN